MSLGTETVPQPSFPMKIQQFAARINNIHTEFVIMYYSNQLFFLVTQLNKLGTIIQVKKYPELSERLSEEESCFSIRILLGKRNEPTLELCARQLMEIVRNNYPQNSIILSIALKEEESQQTKADTLKKILTLLKMNLTSQT
jgi:proteasome assembly chaperone 3